MKIIPDTTVSLISNLQSHGIDPILYGSQGVALHIGKFKEFGDIDLLVQDEWIGNRWDELVAIMAELSFEMVNRHEHEFKNQSDISVGFAAESILTRDRILTSGLQEVLRVRFGRTVVRTLNKVAFLRAYEFSVRDGYRVEQRGKKDADIIKLLSNS